MATSVPRISSASRGGTLSTLMQQTQPNQISPTYTGRGVIPTNAGSNIPITDMNQLQLTPEGAAQRVQDLGAWNNMYMNSPSYNAGGANSYAIQNGPQDSLLASFYGTKAGGNTQVRQPAGTERAQTPATVNNSAGSTLDYFSPNRLSESGGPQYSLTPQSTIQQQVSNNGYLGRISGERSGTTSTTGNPYSAQYPWSNWKLWKQ